MPNQIIGNKLESGHQLLAEQAIQSINQEYTLLMQPDGNLVICRDIGRDTYGKAIWAANTRGKGKYCKMQLDGNFVVCNDVDQPQWNSQTSGRGGEGVVMQDDGNLVIYKSSSVWSSKIEGSDYVIN